MSKNKMTLRFYGGVNEVGGNKVLLEDSDTKILIDFGMSFSQRSKYYSDPFLSPRSADSLKELGVLPDLKGVYEDSTPEVQAVLLSHAHMDHAAYISFLNRKIPVYCGETTKTILDTLNQTRKKGLEFNIGNIQFRTFRTGKKFKIDSLEIEPIHVDHSIPGAYGFIIHTPSATIAYTGDFRTHGTKPEMTEEFIKKATNAQPEAVIPEGTNMTGAEIASESEVEAKLTTIIKKASGIVLADFARADVDRFRSFYKASKRNERTLAITTRQAYLLKALSQDEQLKLPSLKDANIKIFQKTKKKHDKWEQEILTQYEDKVVDSTRISEKQRNIVLTLSFYDFEELVDIKPLPGSCYVLSASEPFNEEMQIDYDRLVNWLKHFGLPHYHVHISGHVMPLELKDTLTTIRPKRIFPIHGEHPELFSKFMSDPNSQITIVEKEKSYELK